MADSKRSGGTTTATKTATPKSISAQGPGDLDDVLTKAIGTRVEITTSTPNSLTLEGTIYTACRITNILALNTSTTPPSATTLGDYQLIPISRIQSLTVISTSAGSGGEDSLPPITTVDLKAVKAREAATIRKIRERDATRGKGVTKEAQDIFDALARTLPTRWHETTIIVNDAVMISSPYGPDNCAAPKEHQAMIIRIKKVLENERRKLAEKSGKAGGAGTKKGG